MAKSGTITAPSGTDANIKALGDANPVTDTLGGLVKSALSAATPNKVVTINLATRKVVVLPTGCKADMDAALHGDLGGTQANITPDADTATSPMSLANGDGTGAAFAAATLAASKPTLSVASLINQAEDFFALPANADKSAVLVVDQAGKTVSMHVAALATVAQNAQTGVGDVVPDAVFQQTIAPTGARQFGE